jgi:hypothetical protein
MRDLETTRAAILHVAEELKRLDNRLAWIGKDLPQLGQGFSVGAELRGAIDAVRLDLLSDAISTLSLVCCASERDHMQRFIGRVVRFQSADGKGGPSC